MMTDGSGRRCDDCGCSLDEVWSAWSRRAGQSVWPLPIVVCDVCADSREIARGMADWAEVYR